MTHSPLALLALSASYFTFAVASLVIVALIVPIAQDLNISSAGVTLLVTAFGLAYAAAAPVFQIIVGDSERRILVAAGLGGIAVGALTASFADSLATMAASRVLMGLGSALVAPMSLASVSGLMPAERQGSGMGVVFMGLTAANVIGIPFSAWVGEVVGWRWVYVAIAFLATAIAVVVLLIEPRDSRGAPVRFGDVKAVLSDRPLSLGIMVMFFQMAAQFATYTLLVPYLTETKAVPLSFVPLAFFLFGVGGVVGNAVATCFVDRVGPERLIIASLVALAAVFLVMRLAPDTPLLAFVLLALWAMFGNMIMAPLPARLVARAPHARNLLLSLNASAVYLGIAIGSALAGPFDGLLGTESLPIVSFVITLLAVAAFSLSRRDTASRDAATGPESGETWTESLISGVNKYQSIQKKD